MTRHSEYWNQIYEDEGRPGWDMDGATPLVDELLDLALPLGLKPHCTLAVPGCGFGHDAAELARHGFQVTGLDFAPLALEGARARHGEIVNWQQTDWFQPGLGPWEAIFDHTCFVAMDPERRPDYIATCAQRLMPGGFWMAVLFHDVNGREGPPFAITFEDFRRLAEPHFEILHLEHATRSHPRRAGREFLLVATKRATSA